MNDNTVKENELLQAEIERLKAENEQLKEEGIDPLHSQLLGKINYDYFRLCEHSEANHFVIASKAWQSTVNKNGLPRIFQMLAKTVKNVARNDEKIICEIF